MMRNFLASRTTPLRAATIMSALLLASCQTSADEVMSLATAEQPATAKGKTVAKTKGYVDPLVVTAGSGNTRVPAPATNGELPLYEPTAAKSSTMAAAYADIAEPPPEVMAVTQQHAAADLGEIIMQPARVDAGNNSLFAATAAPPQATDATQTAGTPAAVASSSSIVPSDMPTMKINAMSKSLFSPSAQQQQGIIDIPENALPLTEADAAASVAALPVAEEEGAPVLKRLSDPRPKRKMVVRAPAPASAGANQGNANGPMPAVDPGQAAIPVGMDANEATPAEQQKKNKFMSSLRRMLTGKKKTESPKL